MANQSGFEYLRSVATKYGKYYFADEIQEFLDQITAEQKSDLAAAYHEIESKGDSLPISSWVRDCSKNKDAVSEGEHEFSCEVGQLFVLFKQLAERGVSPFTSGNVRYIEIQKKPNWDNVPTEIAYLAEAARAYAKYQTEGEMLDFLEKASEDDMEMLTRTAEKMRLNGHLAILNNWLDRYMDGEHQEAWIVYCLLGLMDHAGLNFEPQ